MAYRDPIATLETHEVINQPPELGDYDLYAGDPALGEALHREGAGWAEQTVATLGRLAGSERVRALGHDANRYVPELAAFDRFGRRIDEVRFHPAYHELMALAIRHRVPSIAWSAGRAGGHVAHAALQYVLTQAEAGICCPMAMNYAVVPTLRRNAQLAAAWEPRILSERYDPRCIPAGEKAGATVGMAMTEKQGGSDVRANTTRAAPLDAAAGTYLLRGHKWFCSAPMSDAFMTLAYVGEALSCFFVPRWRPDGTRNPFYIQRLKDKLGNRSNASAEIEYKDTFAHLVGEPGHGVRTIIEMVHHTRLDATAAPAGMMRQAVVLAVHHTAHRTAFQRRLADQPLMQNVLADMVVESEAATALAMRIARAVDEAAAGDAAARLFARTAVPAAKFWVNKRLPNLVYEAMECHGGGGYVEESPLPRLYREAPLNSIWEGSGNVICLDVLRALEREEGAAEAFLAETEGARGADRRLDAALDRLKDALAGRPAEAGARRLTETMALALQGALLVRHAPPAVADAFCASRFDDDWGKTLGTLGGGADLAAIIARATLGGG